MNPRDGAFQPQLVEGVGDGTGIEAVEAGDEIIHAWGLLCAEQIAVRQASNAC